MSKNNLEMETILNDLNNLKIKKVSTIIIDEKHILLLDAKNIGVTDTDIKVQCKVRKDTVEFVSTEINEKIIIWYKFTDYGNLSIFRVKINNKEALLTSSNRKIVKGTNISTYTFNTLYDYYILEIHYKNTNIKLVKLTKEEEYFNDTI